MVLTEFLQANILGNGGYLLSCRAKRVLVTVVIIVCLAVTACEGRNDQVGCGKQQEKMISTRIVGGEDAELGEFPWHAVIFWSAYNTPKYVCGGSIIHERAVISSAYCFLSFNRLVPEDLISVHVGLVNLNATTNDQQVLNVSKIISHPKFLALVSIEYDIAILKLSTNIVMSPSVYPICLWDKPAEHSQLVGKTGTIVGFGMNEYDEIPNILQKAELTVVDIYDCLDNDRETHGRLLTRNMYCAGGKANVSACNGDSGGGMFFEENGTWYLRGIISFIAMRPNATLCDTSKYTIFTDVSRFRDWVMECTTESTTPKRPWHQTPCNSKTVPKHGICNVAHLFDYNFMLIGAFHKIIRIPFNGEKQFLVATTFNLKGLDHDCAQGRFYWINYNTQQILSANYNGTDEKLFIEESTAWPVNLAVDWISRRLYWADTGKHTIEVASLENPNVRTVLIYEHVFPKYIAVDPLQRKLFWVSEYATIEWSNLDGTNRQVLVRSDQIPFIKSIRVSITTGELCSVFERMNQIECIHPHSKQIRTIYSNINDPELLAITDEQFYWTEAKNWNSKTIESMNMNGVRQKPIIVQDPDYSFTIGMTAVGDKCPLLYSPCAINNGDCPENTICLVNTGVPAGKSCVVKRKCKTEYSCNEVIVDN